VLAVGEIGLVTDDLSYKIGDGVTAWNVLGARELTGEFVAATFEAFNAATEPSTPSAGDLIVYAKDVAGRLLPKVKGPSGLDSRLQPALDGNGIRWIMPHTTTTFTNQGTPTFTAVGTVSHPVLAAGSLRSSTRRAIVTSAATANSAAALRVAVAQIWQGDAAGLGGFFATMRFGCSSAVAGQRMIVGWTSSTSAIATTQNPSALTNCFFVGNDASDANLQIMHNDGAGSCTKINLGASFPVPSSVNNAMYEVVFFVPPNGATVGYRVTRLGTGDVASGTLSADLPASTTFLAPHIYVNNNGVAAAVVLDFYRYYVETDY
jgi:hypothetical protein